jgi:hypothetical protein
MSARNRQYARVAANKKQWGATLAEERGEAQDQMLSEGADPNSMSTRDWQLAREERVKANREARGPMVYDQAQGKLVPSGADAQKQEQVIQRLGVSAEDYWDRNPESKRTAVNTRGEIVDVMDLQRASQQERDAKQQRREEVVSGYRADMAAKRKANEEVSAKRFDDFIIAQDQRERDKAKAEAYLKNFNRQARAMRRSAISNSYAGKEGAEGFWERNADIQATAQDLRRMSQADRVKWADTQVKENEETGANKIKTASRPPVVTEEQVAEFFDRPFSLTDFVNVFFGGNRR